MVNKGGCLKGRVRETPNGGCKVGRKNKSDSPYNKRKVTGTGKKMMVEIDGKAKPKKRKVRIEVDTKKRTVRKAPVSTHKMADGTIHTGKTHTSKSKVVKKAPVKRKAPTKPKAKKAPSKPRAKKVRVTMSNNNLCGKAPIEPKPLIMANEKRFVGKGGGDKVRPPRVERKDFKKAGVKRLTIKRKDGSREVRRYDMGVPKHSHMRMISSTVMSQPDQHILTSGALMDRTMKPAKKIVFKKKRRTYA